MSNKECQTYLTTTTGEMSSDCKETQTQIISQTSDTQTQIISQTSHTQTRLPSFLPTDLVDSDTQTAMVYPLGMEISSVVQFL